ncbi:MAG: hypothetical protein ACPGVB_02185, partial [Chitinophagales bacterium]
TYLAGVLTSMQSLKAAFFRPNILFLSLTDDKTEDKETAILLQQARIYKMGAMLYVPYRKVGLGLEKTANLWIYFNNLDDFSDFRVEDVNIALLVAYLLKRNWKAKLNVITVITDFDKDNKESSRKLAEKYMKKLFVLARIPKDVQMYYFFSEISAEYNPIEGEETSILGQETTPSLDSKVPIADINVFALRGDRIDMNRIRERVNSLETSCLYTLDSGIENALT